VNNSSKLDFAAFQRLLNSMTEEQRVDFDHLFGTSDCIKGNADSVDKTFENLLPEVKVLQMQSTINDLETEVYDQYRELRDLEADSDQKEHDLRKNITSLEDEVAELKEKIDRYQHEIGILEDKLEKC